MTNKDILKLYHKVGLETRVRDDFIKEIIESQYKFIREKINELEFKEELSEEQFKDIKTNFAIKYIGKLYTNYRLVSYLIKRKNNGRKFKKQGTKESN